MRRRNLIIGTLAVVLCGVLAVMFWLDKHEPVYAGRKLSVWVISLGTSPELFINREAVRQIGTNGIPFYLEWIRFERNGFGEVLHDARVRLARLLGANGADTPELLRAAARLAFR